MHKKEKLQTAQNIVALFIIIIVIACAFVFKEQIEKYAVTGYFGVFIACVASTATVLLPAPAIFVVVQYAQLLNPVLVVLIGGFGTATGEMLGYFLGKNGAQLTRFKPKGKLFYLFLKHPYKAVFLFSFLPLPVFDIIGICAGALRLRAVKFFSVCLFGKTLKMALYVAFVSYALQYLPFMQGELAQILS